MDLECTLRLERLAAVAAVLMAAALVGLVWVVRLACGWRRRTLLLLLLAAEAMAALEAVVLGAAVGQEVEPESNMTAMMGRYTNCAEQQTRLQSLPFAIT